MEEISLIHHILSNFGLSDGIIALLVPIIGGYMGWKKYQDSKQPEQNAEDIKDNVEDIHNLETRMSVTEKALESHESQCESRQKTILRRFEEQDDRFRGLEKNQTEMLKKIGLTAEDVSYIKGKIESKG